MGKKLKVLNVVLPAACAVTLVAAPMTVWGIEASWAAYNFDVTCIGGIKLSNQHAKLHHDFHTFVTPKNDDEEIDTQLFGKPIIIFVGEKELNDNEFSYAWHDGTLELNVLGEYITEQTLIIFAYTTPKATLELISSKEQSTPKATNSITYEFSFVGTIPADNIINISIKDPIVEPSEDMELAPTGIARVNENDYSVDVDLIFENTSGLETLTPCSINFTLVLQFRSGNTDQEQIHEFAGLTASLTDQP